MPPTDLAKQNKEYQEWRIKLHVFKLNKNFLMSITLSRKSGMQSKDQTKECTEEGAETVKTENLSIS